MIDAASSQRLLQGVFVPILWSPDVAVASIKLKNCHKVIIKVHYFQLLSLLKPDNSVRNRQRIFICNKSSSLP